MLEAGKYKNVFTWLKPPASMGTITAADVFKAKSADEHKAIVKTWAESSWNAWSIHHDIVRSWLPDRQKAAADSRR